VKIFGEPIRESVKRKLAKTKLELPSDYLNDLSTTTGTPKAIRRVTRIMQRNYKLARILKDLYKGRCQICQSTFKMRNGENYSEGHHVIPLGEKGADLPSNFVVLCATCHKKMHYSYWNKTGENRNRVLIRLAGQNEEMRYKPAHYRLLDSI
jgi:5-methylcytosine-specific restriction protein A